MKKKTKLTKYKKKFILGSFTIPRISIFRSNTNISVQAVDDYKNYTFLSLGTHSKTVKYFIKEKNRSKQSYLIGYYFGKMLYRKGIKKVLIDRNGFKYIGRVKNLIEGIRKTGLLL